MKAGPVSQLGAFITFFSFQLILQRAAGAVKRTENRLMFPEGQEATDLREAALVSFMGTLIKQENTPQSNLFISSGAMEM